MAEAIKFTEKEVSDINQLRQDVANVFTQLGQLSVEKSRRMEELDSMESQLLNKHKELVQVETELFENLNKKYGDGNFDPATGEFTPAPKEETAEVEG